MVVDGDTKSASLLCPIGQNLVMLPHSPVRLGNEYYLTLGGSMPSDKLEFLLPWKNS